MCSEFVPEKFLELGYKISFARAKQRFGLAMLFVGKSRDSGVNWILLVAT